MTPDEIHAARLAAAALFATHSPAAHVVSILFHAIDDLERTTVEVNRLRATEAAGEELAKAARYAGAFVPSYALARPALAAALAAWHAAQRGEGAP